MASATAFASFADAANGLPAELALRRARAAAAVGDGTRREAVSPAEAQDRLRRANNLLAFNVADSAAETPDALSATVRDLLAALRSRVRCVAAAERLGRFRDGDRRPVLLRLHSPGDAAAVMDARSGLHGVDRWRGVWIGNDMTIGQRQTMRAARRAADDRPRRF